MRLPLLLLSLVLGSCCQVTKAPQYSEALAKVPAHAAGGRIQRSEIFRALAIPEPGPMATHLNGTPREVIRLDSCVTMELWHNYRKTGVPDPSSMDPNAPNSIPRRPFYYYDQVESIQLYRKNGEPLWRRDTPAFSRRH